MRRSLHPALLGLLVAFMCLAGCSSANTSEKSTTVPATPTHVNTSPPTETPTLALPTFAPVPRPTNVPLGWEVLEAFHFSVAYPPDWALETRVINPGDFIFSLAPATPSSLRVTIESFVVESSDGMAPYCFGIGQVGAPRVPLASLSVAYLAGEGEAGNIREWTYVNTDGTDYHLSTIDSLDTPTIKAQNNSILATFHPDNIQPWTC